METKSPKEQQVEAKLRMQVEDMVERMTDGNMLPMRLLDILLAHPEIKAMQDYANMVSITRIGLNDHGPVHMKKVTRNALTILSILHEAGVQTCVEKEQTGSFTDSILAVMLAAMLHDSGMTIARKNHELYSGIICHTLLRDILLQLLPEEKDIMRRVVISSLAMEGILGHMGSHTIHSIEAGVILIADGCDMTKGRARIALEIPTEPAVGDIHKYSAHSIEMVKIRKGEERPLKIEITMKSEVGFFQVESVLIPKILSSPVQHLVEVYAGVEGEEMKRYR